MSAEPVDVDLESLTPQQFAELVHDSDDGVVRATFRALGTPKALDRIFEIMQERYVAQGDVQAAVQWEITDDGEQYDYVVEIDGSQCTTGSGRAGKATTTLRTDLARFARLTGGQANGIKLLATRKLRASGDVNLARRLPGMFDIPKV